MSGLVPPVIDPSRARVQEAVAHSPFNIFNIIALALIVGIGFYLYRKFLKTPQRRFPLVQPVVPKAETAAQRISGFRLYQGCGREAMLFCMFVTITRPI